MACVALIAISPDSARAQHRLEWHDDWGRVGPAEYIAIGSFVGGHFAIRYLIPPASDAVWTRPVWFDGAVRNAIVLETRAGRTTAGRISDIAALAGLLHPFIDAGLVAGVGDQNPDVATQMGVISAQSYSITLFLNTAAKRYFARERPFGSACAKDPEYTENCEELDRFRSYYSGHAAISATGAGLTCAHHTHLQLYGSSIADLAACLGSLAVTLTTGTLRIASDRHWATDVATGHLLGFSVGYLLPTLLYYRSFEATPDDNESTQPLSQPMRPQLVYGTSF